MRLLLADDEKELSNALVAILKHSCLQRDGCLRLRAYGKLRRNNPGHYDARA